MPEYMQFVAFMVAAVNQVEVSSLSSLSSRLLVPIVHASSLAGVVEGRDHHAGGS